MHRKALVISFSAILIMLAGCGGGDAVTTGSQPAGSAEAPLREVSYEVPAIEVSAGDYRFEVPRQLPGGLVDMALVNRGGEPHFAAFARPTDGSTLSDIRAALAAEAGGATPSAPPPFVEYAALGTVEPGGTSRMTMNLPAGPYVLFCALPSPDGTLHSVKGMMADVDVTEGVARDLPETPGTIAAFDFAFGNLPTFRAGTNRVTLENRGRQLHEIDLVELADGKTLDDAATWAATFEGPAPIRFLGGPAIRAGLSAVGTFEMKPGVRYAFVCIVPDSLGDFAPHLTKGMRSPVFEVPS
jgi:hypothetical protein